MRWGSIFIVSFNYLLYKTPSIGKSPRFRGASGHESSVQLSGMFPLCKFYFLNSFTKALGKGWNEGPYWQTQDWERVLEKCFTPTAKTIPGKIHGVPWRKDLFFPRYTRPLSENIPWFVEDLVVFCLGDGDRFLQLTEEESYERSIIIRETSSFY